MARKKSTAQSNRKRPTKKPGTRRRHHGPLTHLSIEGFRGIRRLEVDGLAPLTVFTGDNGAGKTTLLEAAFGIYGRTTPAWVLNLQGRRGLGAFSKEGPSYLGLFYGSSETGRAVLSGRTEDKTKLRLEIKRAAGGPQTVMLGEGPDDLSNLAKDAPALEFRPYMNRKLENPSSLVWTFTPPNRGELEPRGGKPSDPRAMFQHPSSGTLGEDEKEYYGDAREAGRDQAILELVRAVDPRVVDIEHLQTTRMQYFRASLKGGRNLPLGMLGGGVVNAFRSGVNLAHVGDGFLAIDEVENGLYHQRLPAIFRALVKARRHFGTQLMLATHSHEALTAMVDAGTKENAREFAVVHLRRDAHGAIHATVISGPDAKSSVDHGYDLR